MPDFPADSKSVIDDFLTKVRVEFLSLSSTNWQTNNVGGVQTYRADRINQNTTAAANKRAMIYSSLEGLSKGNTGLTDFGQKQTFIFMFATETNDAQKVGRIQHLIDYGTEGALAHRGVGIEIDNYTVVGEGYDTARKTVALGSVADGVMTLVKIVVNPGVSVQFYINGVLTGTITDTTGVPSGIQDTGINVSVINGAGAANDWLDFIPVAMFCEVA